MFRNVPESARKSRSLFLACEIIKSRLLALAMTADESCAGSDRCDGGREAAEQAKSTLGIIAMVSFTSPSVIRGQHLASSHAIPGIFMSSAVPLPYPQQRSWFTTLAATLFFMLSTCMNWRITCSEGSSGLGGVGCRSCYFGPAGSDRLSQFLGRVAMSLQGRIHLRETRAAGLGRRTAQGFSLHLPTSKPLLLTRRSTLELQAWATGDSHDATPRSSR